MAIAQTFHGKGGKLMMTVLSKGVFQTIDLTAPHDENGRHPQARHLVWVDCEPRYGMYLVTTPAAEWVEVIMSGDDVAEMLGSQNEGEEEDQPPQEGYVSDEYLTLFQ